LKKVRTELKTIAYGFWRIIKMKRLIILTVILTGCAAVCLGRYNSRASQLKIVQLSEPRLTGPVSLEQALAKRRSVRRFTAQELDFVQIGQLAWAGQGITQKQKGFRTAPSAGAIYPIKLYFATREGIFLYEPDKHSLNELLNTDVRSALSAAALKQKMVANAPCDIIIAGSAKKLAAKYGNKAKKYMLLEAGHIAQNIHLQAVSLGLGSVSVGAFDVNQVRRICKLPMMLEPVYIICVGYPAGHRTAEAAEPAGAETGWVKKAVLIIADENFRDEEFFETRDALTEAAVDTVTASTKRGFIKGVLGGRAEATVLLKDIFVDDYDAIIFVGGPGAKQYFSDRIAWNIARMAAEKQKVLAAICIAPSILANAGVLDGVRATSYSSERVSLKKAGAIYTGSAVERDGFIITATGPKAARRFGETIVDALEDK
jgi:protease I